MGGFIALVTGCVGAVCTLYVSTYDELYDYTLYQGDATFIKLVPGSFAIFYPNDLHMPGIDEYKTDVKKMVIKVRI